MKWLRVALLSALAACSSSPAPAGGGGSGGSGGQPPAHEICDNGIDDDGNDDADCADAACTADPHCPFCGDGLRQAPEVCDGGDLGDASCATQHFNGGGLLACQADCTLDTSGCRSHEDCSTTGDEDGNGLADCLDPACAPGAACLTLAAVDPPAGPVVTSAAMLVVKLADGTGAGVPGRSIHLAAPAGAAAPPGPLLSGADGEVRFDIRLGRLAGTQTFTATVDGSDLLLEVALQAVEPVAGHVHSIVNASHENGADSSGPAIAAHVGKILDLDVASDDTLYLAEPCRILAVSPVGVLSVVAGTGICGSAADGTPALDADLQIAALALDEPRGRLVFVDPSAGTVRALDLAAGILSTLAGGGDGIVANELAVGADGTLYISDAQSNSLRRVAPDGTLSTALTTPVSLQQPCGEGVALQECGGVPCRPLVDADGHVFVAGLLCGKLVDPDVPDRPNPGMLRLPVAGVPPGLPVHLLGVATGLDPLGQRSTRVHLQASPRGAFDRAGNLFAVAGQRLMRVDDRTWAATTLAAWDAPVFAGEDVAVDGASFASPGAVAFGGSGDLYVADTDDASVRRVVAVGNAAVAPVTVTVTDGASGVADLGQKMPAFSVRIEDAGKPLATFPVSVVPDDPGMAVYPHDTGLDGVSTFEVRAGFVPGEHTVKVSLPDLHGGLVPGEAVFHITAREPRAGNILSMTRADVIHTTTPFTMAPGQVLASTSSDLQPFAMAVAPDGAIFALTQSRQVVELSPRGTLTLVGGLAHSDDVVDGDGGPAVNAHLLPVELAASRDAVFLLEQTGPGQIRVIDRATGIVDSYVPSSARSLAVGSDGALLTDDNGGIARIDPVTRVSTYLVPAIDDCSTGDGLARGEHYFAVGGEAIAFSAQVCNAGIPDVWTGSFDPVTGAVRMLLPQFSSTLALSPAGAILLGGLDSVQSLDPTTLQLTSIAGPADNLEEDVPATRSSIWSLGHMAFDPDGHLLLQVSERIRIVW